MKVTIKKIEKNVTTDFTQILMSATWSGETNSVSRKLEFTIVSSDTDASIPKIKLNAGNKITLTAGPADGKTTKLFTGYIFSFDQSHHSDSISYTAYDPLKYLMKSEACYNFKGTTAESVAKKILKDFSIPKGTLAKTKIPYKCIHIAVPLYNIIMHAYKQASKRNGKKYQMTFTNGKINVIEKGAVVKNFTLQNKVNLTESNYSFSIENMVNSVVIVNKNGKKVGEVKNKKWIDDYGRLQKVYQKEEQKKGKGNQPSATKKATTLLQGAEKQASVSALGDIRCTSGKGVNLNDPYTGLTGRFWIQSDSHTFQSDAVLGSYSHTMDLTLEYKNIMYTGD